MTHNIINGFRVRQLRWSDIDCSDDDDNDDNIINSLRVRQLQWTDIGSSDEDDNYEPQENTSDQGNLNSNIQNEIVTAQPAPQWFSFREIEHLLSEDEENIPIAAATYNNSILNVNEGDEVNITETENIPIATVSNTSDTSDTEDIQIAVPLY